MAVARVILNKYVNLLFIQGLIQVIWSPIANFLIASNPVRPVEAFFLSDICPFELV